MIFSPEFEEFRGMPPIKFVSYWILGIYILNRSWPVINVCKWNKTANLSGSRLRYLQKDWFLKNHIIYGRRTSCKIYLWPKDGNYQQPEASQRTMQSGFEPLPRTPELHAGPRSWYILVHLQGPGVDRLGPSTFDFAVPNTCRIAPPCAGWPCAQWLRWGRSQTSQLTDTWVDFLASIVAGSTGKRYVLMKPWTAMEADLLKEKPGWTETIETLNVPHELNSNDWWRECLGNQSSGTSVDLQCSNCRLQPSKKEWQAVLLQCQKWAHIYALDLSAKRLQRMFMKIFWKAISTNCIQLL